MTSIVYFVGAGLSKALESSARIPVMADFVSVLADRLDDDVILFTLAKLEDDRAFSFTRPEWLALAKEICQHRTGQRPPELRGRYRRILKNRPAENIESILQKAGGTRFRFAFAINRLFSDIEWNVNWLPLERFLNRMLMRPETRHTFVSFNYDLLLDRCVQWLSAGRWQPRRGYGVTFNQFVTPAEVDKHMGQFPKPEPGEFPAAAVKPLRTQPMGWTSGPDDDGAIRILKPHGSLNWLVAFDGNYKFDLNPSPCVVMNDDTSLTHLRAYEVRDLWSLDQELVANMGLYVAPPVSHKRDPGELEAICQMEQEALTTADEIYVIGWSIPETDGAQIALIGEIAHERTTPFNRVVLVNRDAPLEYFERVAKVLRKPLEDCEIVNSGFVALSEPTSSP